jgi:hypothetical protein
MDASRNHVHCATFPAPTLAELGLEGLSLRYPQRVRRDAVLQRFGVRSA